MTARLVVNSGRPEDIPRESVIITTVSFNIPKRAAEALNTAAVAERVRAAGFSRTQFEISSVSVPVNQRRITCQRHVVAFIVDALTAVALRSEGELVTAAAMGAMAGLDALEPPSDRRPPWPEPGPIPDTGTVPDL